MKRLCLSIIALVSTFCLYAQDAYDAFKFAQQDLYGTARYVGMSGAFAALGGDPSAVKDNPAALGVFRQSDVSITLDLNWERTIANWNGGDDYTARAFRLSCGQANWIQNFKTANVESGLITHSLMLGYHRLKNYDRETLSAAPSNTLSMTDYISEMSAGIVESQLEDNGFYNIDVPWLTVLGYEGFIVDPDDATPGSWNSVLAANEHVAAAFKLSETGWVDEYNLGWGANVSNKIYFGLSLAMRSMRYNKNVVYSEVFGQGGEFELSTDYRVKGLGINVAGGIIYRPIDVLRVSLSAQSPTFMSYKESYNANIKSWGLATTDRNVSSPGSDVINYQLTNPWRLTGGLAVTTSNIALFSLQLDYEFLRAMRYQTNSGNANAWKSENQTIRNHLGDVLSCRVGTEWFITNNFAIRVGYALKMYFNSNVYNRYLATNTARTDTEFGKIAKQNYIGAGFGFRNQLLIADIAYQYRFSKESITPFNGNDPIDMSAASHRVVFTIGIK